MPPVNVSGRALSSTEIMVQWSEVLSDIIREETTHYEVLFLPINQFEQEILNGSVFTIELSIILSDLEEFVEYNISVRAHNNGGAGPYSEGITVATMEDGKCTHTLGYV